MNPALSKLDDNPNPLVLDASVLINLIAMDAVAELLRALPGRAIVEEITLLEVLHDPRDGSSARAILDDLFRRGLLQEERMGDSALKTFLSLTGAQPPNDLADGEAATLAHALQHDGAAITDDKKASRIAHTLFPHLKVYCTLDILSSAPAIAALTSDEISLAVYQALIYARMRVPLRFDAWVRQCLGHDRVAQCVSLKRR